MKTHLFYFDLKNLGFPYDMVCICNFIVVDFDSILVSVSNTILVKLHV